jgi:hypothetical protein
MKIPDSQKPQIYKKFFASLTQNKANWSLPPLWDDDRAAEVGGPIVPFLSQLPAHAQGLTGPPPALLPIGIRVLFRRFAKRL